MFVNNVSSYLPTIKLATPEQAVKNLTKIALPVIGLVAASMVVEVKAITLVDCIHNCDLHKEAHDLAKLACYALCWLFHEK